jgi:hypothetical protein
VAGLAYFTLVFSVAFGFGVVRMLVLVPRLGALAAVALEVPLLLVVSWAAAGLVIRRLKVVRGWPLTVMGTVAFGVLMGVEVAMTVAMGGSVAVWVASLGTPAGGLGLSGQILFGAIPLLWIRG